MMVFKITLDSFIYILTKVKRESGYGLIKGESIQQQHTKSI